MLLPCRGLGAAVAGDRRLARDVALRRCALTSVSAPLWRSLRLTALLGLGLVCWLDPRWGEEAVDVERRGLDLVFCLDTSQSMLARDMQPTRLDRAKRDIRSVLPLVEGGDRVGLVVFAGEARLWIPLTQTSLRLMDCSTRSTPTSRASAARTREGLAELGFDPDDVATTVVVLMTDGEDLGRGPASCDRAERPRLDRVHGRLRRARQQDHRRARRQRGVLAGPTATRCLTHGPGEPAQAGGGDRRGVRASRGDGAAAVELHEKRFMPMEGAYDAGEEESKQARTSRCCCPCSFCYCWRSPSRMHTDEAVADHDHCAVPTAVGGDREEGPALSRRSLRRAQAAFARALQAEPDSAELQELALAAWPLATWSRPRPPRRICAGSDEAAETAPRHVGRGSVRRS